MPRSTPRLFIALFAAPLLAVSPAALAGNPCNNIELAATGQCEYQVSGGCTAECTPGNLVAACDGSCDVDADASCTTTCEASCETSCAVDPPSFDCSADCTSTCEQGCMSWCSDAACQTDCNLDCANRCDFKCSATKGSVDCTAQCQASCGGSCQVEVNVDCHAMCTASVEAPKCTTACATPQGALFCDGQYVDLGTDATACTDYLKSQGLTVSESCSTSTQGGGSCTASIGCSAAPSLAAGGDRWGMFGMTGLMMGLGLVASRRRRR